MKKDTNRPDGSPRCVFKPAIEIVKTLEASLHPLDYEYEARMGPDPLTGMIAVSDLEARVIGGLRALPRWGATIFDDAIHTAGLRATERFRQLQHRQNRGKRRRARVVRPEADGLARVIQLFPRRRA